MDVEGAEMEEVEVEGEYFKVKGVEVEVEGVQFEVKGWRLRSSLRSNGRRWKLRGCSLWLRGGGAG